MYVKKIFTMLLQLKFEQISASNKADLANSIMFYF